MENLKQDAESLLAKTTLSDGVGRRDFMKVALGTGFAVAALPVVAQTMIHTDTAGLTAGIVKVNVGGTEVPFYRAQPEGKTNLPVVLVISEIFGLHALLADMARRVAILRYFALAHKQGRLQRQVAEPGETDLFVRQGD